jgi:hypothetical protein
MEGIKNSFPIKLWLKNFNRRDHLGDPVADERIILKWILDKYSVKL